MEDFEIRDCLIGYNSNGGRIYVEATLHTEGREVTTTEHDKVASFQRLSFMGEVYAKNNYREPHNAGQIDLSRVVRPAEGKTLEDIQELAVIWKRWHLNDMKAACAHMPENARQLWDQRQEVLCEEGTGYKYGTAWLYEPVPDAVIARVREILQ